MLELRNVSKTFSSGLIPKKVRALDNVNLTVRSGEVYAFLGPNGAGKTTTIKIILGIIRQDSGEVRIDGEDARKPATRRKVGYLPDQPYFYDELTAEEYLRFAGKLAGLSRSQLRERIPALLERVGLTGKEKRRLRGFSRGMLQRLGMAQALIHDPTLLILDEPMTGLDPIGRKEFRDLILSLKQEGKTIFFSSHILADAEIISDRIGILNRGRLVRETDLATLQSEQDDELEVSFQFFGDRELIKKKAPLQIDLFDQGGVIRLRDRKSIFDAIRWIEEAGGSVLSVQPRRKSLEDIFMEELQR